MNRKKKPSHSFNVNEKNNNFKEKKSKFKRDNRSKLRHRDDIKVVSTNIIKPEEKFKTKIDFKERENTSYRSDKKFNGQNEKTASIKNKRFQPQNKVDKSIISSYKINSIEKKNCFKCKKIIDDMTSSIFDKNKNEYYHFNCIINEIKIDNRINNSQRIVYLGSGAFGIIENSSNNGSMKFTIKKKIQYLTNE